MEHVIKTEETETIKRNIPIEHLIAEVHLPIEDPKDTSLYFASFTLRFLEIKKLNLKLSDLQQILVDVKRGVVGLVFSYKKRNFLRKDILIKQKVNKELLRSLSLCPSDNTVVIYSDEEGKPLEYVMTKMLMKL